MTVTIAALCGASHAAQTANIILCADTMITFCVSGVPASSNQNGTKIYDLPLGFFVAIADDISRSHQVVSYLYNEMKHFDAADPRLTDLIKLALDKTAEYVRLWMRREVLAEYGNTEDEFLHDQNLRDRAEIAHEIRSRVFSTQLSIAGFSHANTPVFFFTDCINTQEQSNPGFFCGGAGADLALSWLNFRGQNSFMSVQRTFYHVREAKAYSQLCPVVGGMHHVLLLRPGKAAFSVSEGSPVVTQWQNNYWTKPTDGLDKNIAWEELVANYGIPT
jgi:hypothetical protein